MLIDNYSDSWWIRGTYTVSNISNQNGNIKSNNSVDKFFYFFYVLCLLGELFITWPTLVVAICN